MSLALRSTTKHLHGSTASRLPVQILCISITLAFLSLFLLGPLLSVFYEAFKGGWKLYWASITHKDSLHSVKMTLLVTALAVPLNTIFGVAAAWCIAKFQFKGKSLLITLIDIPFAVSPVISGMIFVLLFGRGGTFGPWLEANNIKIIFALPGMVLATAFVTFPFIARELIPLMSEQGNEEELAAVSLGANGFQTFFRVTLPNIRWGLLYGIILCNARAMGEFGAVSVVTLNAPGDTNTIPREIQNVYDAYNIPGAYALSTLLAAAGLITLIAKSLLAWKIKRDMQQNSTAPH